MLSTLLPPTPSQWHCLDRCLPVTPDESLQLCFMLDSHSFTAAQDLCQRFEMDLLQVGDEVDRKIIVDFLNEEHKPILPQTVCGVEEHLKLPAQ